MAKKKIISDILASALLFALNLVENRFIDKIPVPDVRMGAKLLLSPIRNMIKAASDDIPENADQIRAIWRRFINTDFADFGAVQLDKLVAGIKNARLKAILSILVSPSIELTRAMTDENPANDEQAKEILDNFLRNPDTHEVVLQDLLRPILEKTIKDPGTVAFILSLIAEALKKVQDGSLSEEQREAIIIKLQSDIKLLEAA